MLFFFFSSYFWTPFLYTEVIEVILHVFGHHEHLFFITQERIVINQSVAQEGDKVKKKEL